MKQTLTLIAEMSPKEIINVVTGIPKIAETLGDATIVTSVDESATYYSNKMLVSIILSQLIHNALKYRHEGRNHKVIVSLKADEERILLSVIDNGSGIDKEDMPYIFNRHHIRKNARSRGGLGLTIVKSAVDQLGGVIELNSRVGHGTEMVLSIPNGMPE